MSVDGRRLLYLSLWRHLLLRGGGQHRRLQLLWVGFGRDVLLFVRVLEAIFGEMGHLREGRRRQLHLRTNGSDTPDQQRLC